MITPRDNQFRLLQSYTVLIHQYCKETNYAQKPLHHADGLISRIKSKQQELYKLFYPDSLELHLRKYFLCNVNGSSTPIPSLEIISIMSFLLSELEYQDSGYVMISTVARLATNLEIPAVNPSIATATRFIYKLIRTSHLRLIQDNIDDSHPHVALGRAFLSDYYGKKAEPPKPTETFLRKYDRWNLYKGAR